MSYSNEHLRASDKASAALKATELPRNLAQPIEKQTGDALKKENLIYVLEARLARLQNYKLTRDIKLLDEKTYTERANQLSAYITALKTPASTLPVLSREELNLISQVNNASSPADILRLIRADNGSDQVEAIAAKNLGEIFAQGVAKLNNDGKAKTEITRRANKHFGDMLSQGVFDQATPEQKNAAQAGLEALYQMRYIAKEYIDEKGGITVPTDLKNIWENYRDSMDIKDEWFTWSDSGKTQLAGFLLYDLVPMLVSGGAAGLAGKGIIKVASKMPAITNYVNSGTKVAKVVSVGARTGLAGTEAVIFDASFEAIRNQRMFTSKPNWQQDLIKNAFGFGFSRYLAGATKFTGVPLDPLSNQLVKQGLVVPAIITGVGVSQKLLANDPDAYHGAWEEFLLGAIMTGAFHVTGKALERKSTAPESGIAKVESSTNGNEVVVTATNGQTFTTRMTEKLKNAIQGAKNLAEAATTKIKSGIQKLKGKGDDNKERSKTQEITPNTELIDLQRQIDTKKAELSKIKDFELSPMNSVEFGQAFNNGLTLNYRVELLPNGNHRVKVKEVNGSEWKNATEEYGLPASGSGMRKHYDARIEKELGNLRRSASEGANTHVVASKEFGQAFNNGLTLNYRVELLPNGEHKVSVRGTNMTEWKTATEEYGIPKLGSSMRAGYDARIAKEVAELKKDPNYRTIENMRQLAELEKKMQEASKTTGKENAQGVNTGKSETTKSEVGTKSSETQKNQDAISHSNTTDAGAKARIEKEHGIGEKKLTQQDLLGGSFRTEMAEIMQMDDATFQKNFTEVQYRKGKEGIRPHEVEMYESAAKVRNMSEADIIAHADDIVKGNREFMGSLHPNRGPSNLSQSEKALLVAENAALRQRLVNIVGDKVPGGVVGIAEDAAKGNKSGLIEKFKKIAPWLLGAIIAALFLSQIPGCDPKKAKPPAGPLTPDKVADAICESCRTGPESIIDNKRKNEYGKTLTETYRKDITKRWMAGKEWQIFATAFSKNKSLLSALSSPNQKSVVDAINKVLEPNGATVENVQQLQKCIGMFTVISSSGPVRSVVTTLDHKGAQDGILGPNTTKALMDFINICNK